MPKRPSGLDYCFLDETDERDTESVLNSYQKSLELRTPARFKQETRVSVNTVTGLDISSDAEEDVLNKGHQIGYGMEERGFNLSEQEAHDD